MTGLLTRIFHSNHSAFSLNNINDLLFSIIKELHCIELLEVAYSSYINISVVSLQNGLLVFPRIDFGYHPAALTWRGKTFIFLFIVPPNRVLSYFAIYLVPRLYFGFPTSSSQYYYF